jgi:NAD(P)-dependent dehydrogenase (short-subunit alcohol dehydrogenase family)
MAAYSASKAAVLSITQSLAEELAQERIWVNAVVPSVMDTPQNRAGFPAGTDFSKWPSVEEVARTVVFLASEENAVTRGAAVPVYGRS